MSETDDAQGERSESVAPGERGRIGPRRDGSGEGSATGARPDRVTASGERATVHAGAARVAKASRIPLVLLGAVYAVNISHQFLLSAVFPLIKTEFRVSDTALGLLGGSFLLLSAVGVGPFGVLADRLRRTRMIGWGTAVWGFAMIGSGMAGSYGQLFAARSLLGITDAIDNPTSYSLLTDYYPAEERGRVFGLYNTGQLIGIFAIPIGGLIADQWGWREAFHFFALPGFVLALLVWMLPEPERGQRDREAHDIEGGDRESRYSRMTAWQGFRELVRVPTFLVALLSIGIASFFTRGLGVWAATFLIRYHDMAVATAASALALLAVGGVVGSVAGGVLADRLVRRGTRNGRLYVAGGSNLLTLLILFPAFATDSTPLMLALFGVGAAFLVAPQPVLNATYANVVHPHLRGRSNSSDQLAQTLFGALSPLILGALADAFTLRTAILTMLPLVAVAGVVLLLLGPRFLPRDEERIYEDLSAEAAGAGAGSA